MSETIHAQFGQCGNNIGKYFWNNIKDEMVSIENSPDFDHSMNQMQNPEKYFEKTTKNEYFPRSIFVDLDPDGKQHLVQSSLYYASSFIFGTNGAGNNWARGHYTDGAELMENVMDMTRIKAEKCDYLKNIQIFHGLGGGTGSGMGSLYALKAKEEYPKQFLSTFSVIPSSKISDCIVEPYNFVLANRVLNEFCDAVIFMDNDALIELYFREFGISEVLIRQMNHFIGSAMSNITYCDRFKGTDSYDFIKLATNLIPLPNLKFLTVGLSPLILKECTDISSYSLNAIIEELLSLKNMFCKSKQSETRILAATGIFIGKFSIENDELQIDQKHLESSNFVEWAPNNFKNLKFNVQPKNNVLSGTLIYNSDDIIEPFNRFSNRFEFLFNKKSFVRYYLCEGMDEFEFIEAHLILNELIDAYIKI